MLEMPVKRKPCTACDGLGTWDCPDIPAMARMREEAGLSRAAVARAAGWQASIVSELESGARPMTEANAARYWSALRGLLEPLKERSNG